MRAIERKYYSLISRTIFRQLQFQPDVETRNRKPLERAITFEVSWELRFGPKNRFRVFYDVLHEEQEVHIVAIGVKKRNRLYIGGEELREKYS